MSPKRSANARKAMVAENDLATVYDVDSFLGKIKEQRKYWMFFQAELWQTEVEGKKYFKAKIYTIPEVVYGSSMAFSISGAERKPIEINVSYGPGSEQLSIATHRDLANARSKAKKWSDVLSEFAEICDFLKLLVLEHPRPVSKNN